MTSQTGNSGISIFGDGNNVKNEAHPTTNNSKRQETFENRQLKVDSETEESRNYPGKNLNQIGITQLVTFLW